MSSVSCSQQTLQFDSEKSAYNKLNTRMKSYLHWHLLAFLLNCLILSSLSSAQKESVQQNDRECDLNAASKCISFGEKIVSCYLSPQFNPNTCLSQATFSDQSFEEVCSTMNSTVNSCLMGILGNDGCNGTENGFYHQWLNPINAVLNKLCSPNASALRGLVQLIESDCGKGGFLNCLRQTEIDLIELISTEMMAETCTNFEVELQICLHRQFDESHCTTLVDTILDLGKVFVDNAACSNQPFILVPFQDKEKQSKESDDRDCAPRLAAECFEPMWVKWNCYLDKKCSTNFTELCSYTEYAINTCGKNILVYGCENTPTHHFYKDWAQPMTSAYLSVCQGNPDKETSIRNEKGCWLDFLSCFQKSDIAGNALSLITSKITPPICSELTDTIEFCLSGLNFPQCDSTFEMLETIRVNFAQIQSCKQGHHETSHQGNHSSPNIICYITSIFFIYTFYYVSRS